MILDEPEVVAHELGLFRRIGGSGVAEVTVQGWGRDVSVLRRISTQARVHVIATSGFYVEACHPESVTTSTVDELASSLVAELTQGADGTAIRTGLLKIAISHPLIDGAEEKCAHAVALAQRETGFSITTHSGNRFEVPGGNLGMELMDLFESHGVPPERVIIGHTDGKPDIRQLKRLAGRGAYVQFDMIGNTHWLRDNTRAELVCHMVKLGFADRILLAGDCCNTIDLRTYGGKGYDYVLREFVPRLSSMGITRQALDQILISNPAEALSRDM